VEPVTHFLTGACLSRAGFNRKTALATFTMVIGAEAADIDIVCYLKGSTFGFAHHRGITHTFVGVPFIAAAVVLFVWIVYKIRQRFRRNEEGHAAWLRQRGLPEKPRWLVLYGLAVIAGLSHLLLDFTNNYGVRPFEPFSYQWHAWDIVFIYEPLLYVFLIGGLVLPGLFSLINEEIGSRAKKPRGAGGAIVALILMVALWGFRDFQHRKALAAMNDRLYEGQDAISASAFPYPLNPFRWAGVAETETLFENMEVNSRTGEVDPRGRGVIRYKPEETDATLAAKSSNLGRVFLDWARYPLVEVETRDVPVKSYVVRFMDLRFRYPDQDRRVLSPTVELDSNLRVIDEWWGDAPAEKVR
jgi:inner membrane protein